MASAAVFTALFVIHPAVKEREAEVLIEACQCGMADVHLRKGGPQLALDIFAGVMHEWMQRVRDEERKVSEGSTRIFSGCASTRLC